MTDFTYIYFGSSQFSLRVIESFCACTYLPIAIVTKPDKPRSRGLKVTATDVSGFAQRNAIAAYKPLVLDEENFLKSLDSFAADLFIVADYGRIMPVQLLARAPKGCLCVHPSLLPRYRGPSPIESSLLNGDKASGVTIFNVNQRVDAGDILLQKHIDILPEDDYFSLSDKLAVLGAACLAEVFSQIQKYQDAALPQKEADATFTRKLIKADGIVDWGRSACDIARRVRALARWPSVWTHYGGKRIHLLAVEALEGSPTQDPGTCMFVDKGGIDVATASGVLRVLAVKPEGKNIMDAWSFACGYRIARGDRFE